MDMEYRRLGRAGLKVSVLSLGSWVTFHNQVNIDCGCGDDDGRLRSRESTFSTMQKCMPGGKSEEVMGAALKKLGWRRSSYLVSTKFFWGLNDGPNETNTLNRKRLLEGMDASLRRFGLDYVDLIFCHRPDPQTPIEETAHAMHDIVQSGRAIYWGVSEWSADEIRAAWSVCDRYGWHKPTMEQPQYNLFNRGARGKGICTPVRGYWFRDNHLESAGFGMLTGKYINGIPKDSRGALKGYGWLKDELTNKDKTREGQKAGTHCKGIGLHTGTICHRLVREESEREHGHHRRQPRGAGAREPEGAQVPSEVDRQGDEAGG